MNNSKLYIEAIHVYINKHEKHAVKYLDTTQIHFTTNIDEYKTFYSLRNAKDYLKKCKEYINQPSIKSLLESGSLKVIVLDIQMLTHSSLL